MLTGPILIGIFVLSLVILLVSIIKFKVNPFIALIGTSFATAFIVGMPMETISGEVAKGFGNTLTSVGIVIGCGIVLGKLLAEAFAIDQIANTLLNRVGNKRAPLAINIAGYIVSIPVFLDAAFIIFMPLLRQVARKSKIPLLTLVTALAVGSITAHCLVVPTPGPLAVAGNMGIDIGVFLFYSLIVSIPGALVGGWLYGTYIGKNVKLTDQEMAAMEAASAEEKAALNESVKDWKENNVRPTFARSMAVLLFPILLILIGNFGNMFLEAGTPAFNFLKFIGDKNVALFAGVVVAIIALRKFFNRPANEYIVEACESGGLVLLITGAGGAFGNIINTTGIGDYLVESLSALNISVLILGFVLSQILRAAQGSATVALVTTSAILGPVVATSGDSAVLVGLAICAGAIGLSLPNDSGFWVISRFGNLSVPNTIRSWTIGGSISGLVTFGMILLLSLFSGVLPGL